jgi:hypothetical protein
MGGPRSGSDIDLASFRFIFDFIAVVSDIFCGAYELWKDLIFMCLRMSSVVAVVKGTIS